MVGGVKHVEKPLDFELSMKIESNEMRSLIKLG